MTDRFTSWDPALLRKFSSTGHFRLLNQLKGDLRKKPLDRDQRTGQLKSLEAFEVQADGRPPQGLPNQHLYLHIHLLLRP